MMELKPCPFCGGEASLKLQYPPDLPIRLKLSRWAIVSCDSCAAAVTRAGLDGTEEGATKSAAEAWNTRTPPSDWREARELLDQTHQPDSGNLTAAYLVGLADGKAEARGTCHDTFTRFDAWTCSECGERIDYGFQPIPGEYCRGCGAKVVEE